MPTPPGPFAPLDLSVVAPAHNEEDNIAPLIDQIGSALSGSGLTFEAVIVDDGSTDSTRARLTQAMATRPWVRCIAMTSTPPGKGNGQSAAFYAGFRAARGDLIAVLDADLQNDPAEIPAMVALLRKTGAGLVQGDRSHNRKDNAVRRIGSIVGRTFRRTLLGDTIRDTGCSLRVMRRELALKLPLEFRGMHRFIPITAIHLGFHVEEMRVSHRPRVAGTTKYGFGIIQRALPGLIDLFAVRYMRTRRRPVTNVEVAPGAMPTPPSPRSGHGAAPPGAARSNCMKAGPLLAMAVVLGLCIWIMLATSQSAPPTPGAAQFEVLVANRKAKVEQIKDPADPTRFTYRVLNWSELAAQPPMSAAAFEAFIATNAGATQRSWMLRVWNVSSWGNLLWVALGLGGQLVFSGRMLIQWFASEKERRSVVPPAFWYMSLAGGILLTSYFVWRHDLVAVLGQAMGLVVYVRNIRLLLLHRNPG